MVFLQTLECLHRFDMHPIFGTLLSNQTNAMRSRYIVCSLGFDLNKTSDKMKCVYITMLLYASSYYNYY